MADVSVRPQTRRSVVKGDTQAPDAGRVNIYAAGETVGLPLPPSGVGDNYETVVGDIPLRYVSRDGTTWDPVESPKPYPWKPEEAWTTPGGMAPVSINWTHANDWSNLDDATTVTGSRLIDRLTGGTTTNLFDVAGIAGLNAIITSDADPNHYVGGIGGGSTGISANFRGFATGSVGVEFNQPVSLDVLILRLSNTGVGSYTLTGGGVWSYVGPLIDNTPVITGIGTSTLTIDSTATVAQSDFEGEFQITGQITKLELIKVSGTGGVSDRPSVSARDWNLTGVGVPQPQTTYTVQRYIDGSLIAVRDEDRTIYQKDLTGLIPLGNQVVTQVITVNGHGYNLPAWNFLPLGVGGVLAQDAVVDTVFYATRILDTNRLEVVSSGYVDAPAHGLAVGVNYYVDPTTPGAITTVKPRVDSKRIAIAISADTVVLFDQGFVAVSGPSANVVQLNAAAPLTFGTLAYEENQLYLIENLDAVSTSALNKIAAGNMFVNGVVEADGIYDLAPLESTIAFRTGDDIHLRPVGGAQQVTVLAKNTADFTAGDITLAFYQDDPNASVDGVYYPNVTPSANLTFPSIVGNNGKRLLWATNWSARSAAIPVPTYDTDTDTNATLNLPVSGWPADGTDFVWLIADEVNNQWLVRTAGNIDLSYIVPTFSTDAQAVAGTVPGSLYMGDGTVPVGSGGLNDVLYRVKADGTRVEGTF